IFHRNEFLDPLGTSFKFDRHARETVGWRRRRDPPKESFFVDDERDGFACRQPCSSISLCFLVCYHCSTLHRGPPCEGLHRIQDGAPCTTPGSCPVCTDDPGPRPPRSAVVQGDCWVRSPMGCQALKDLQTLTRSTKPPGDRTHERDSQSTCEPAYERLAALLPARRSVLPPGS